MVTNYKNIDWNEKKLFYVRDGEPVNLTFEELWKRSKRIACGILYHNFPRYVYLKDDLLQECSMFCMRV